MKLAKLLILTLATSSLALTADAGERPAPRTPIGPPPLEMNLAPAVTARPPLPADKIRIVNPGVQPLYFAFWEGRSWVTAALGPRQETVLSCSMCQGAFSITFHNSKEQTTAKVRGGDTYHLVWSNQTNAWVLTSHIAR